MRKENSSFNIHFMSQPGVQILHNNDYYGCSELDDFACYVVADGLRSGNHKQLDPSARMAVEAVISAFNEKPSISRRAIAGYMKIAHDTLYNSKYSKCGKASVMVVVTNYQRLRYGYSGNCRFNLFRSGRLIEESNDNSFALELVKSNRLQKDKIAKHEERNNLDMYCGIMAAFKPTISKKIKLRETDVFSIFTRGIWENAHTNDIMAAIQAGENNPEETAYNLERLILDKVSKDGFVDNYTTCFVFVDKLYVDANEKKRRKKIIIISLIALLIIAIIIILVVVFTRRRNQRREDMYFAYHAGIEFIQANNFIRAREELKTAYSFAEKLRDKRHRLEITNHQMLVESVLHAESLLEARSYEQAVDAFGAAANRSRYAYNLALLHIETRRGQATGYMNVHEFIFLGDALADIGDFDNAESKYLLARNLASRLFYTEGRKLAIESLEALYRLKAEEIERQNDEAQAEATAQVTAAELLIEGDNSFRDGDFIAARLFYQLAREKYVEIGSSVIVASIDERLALTEQRMEQADQNFELAESFVLIGDNFLTQGDYNQARRFFLLARDIYMSLEEEAEARDTMLRLEIVELLIIGEATAARNQAEQLPPPATPAPEQPPITEEEDEPETTPLIEDVGGNYP